MDEQRGYRDENVFKSGQQIYLHVELETEQKFRAAIVSEQIKLLEEAKQFREEIDEPIPEHFFIETVPSIDDLGEEYMSDSECDILPVEREWVTKSGCTSLPVCSSNDNGWVTAGGDTSLSVFSNKDNEMKTKTEDKRKRTKNGCFSFMNKFLQRIRRCFKPSH